MRRAALLLTGLLLPAAALAEEGVRVRVGNHAAHGRVVFDWPSRTGYEVQEAEGRITLRFAAPATFDLAGIRRPPRNVEAIEQADGRVTIGIAPGTRPRVFRLGTRIVVDVLDAPAGQAEAARPAASPAAPPRPAPASPARLERAPTVAIPAATHAQPAVAPAQEALPPAPRPAAAPSPSSAPPAPQEIARSATPDRFVIPAAAGVGAALLQRGGGWLLVLDAPLTLDPSRLPGGAAAEVTTGPLATVLRLPLDALPNPVVTRRPEGWVLARATEAPATRPIRPELDPGPPAQLLLRAERAANAVPVLDPETGGTLLVGTVREGGEATPVGRATASFDILPTRLGAAILPRADIVTLRAVDGGFATIPGVGADLALGNEPPSESAAAQLSRLFDLPDEALPALVQRERNATLAVAAAPPLGRGGPRLRNAEALLALGLGPEAQAMAALAMREDPRLAEDPKAHALHGAAALVAGRLREADGLLHRRLPESDELELWRGLLSAARGEDGAARIAAGLPLLCAWPEPLRARLLPLAAESLALGGETAAAQRLLAGLEQGADLALARAMLQEKRGETAAAIEAYGAVAIGRDRRARAVAMRRGLELRLATGALDAAGAAAGMEAVLAAWRGDARERDARLRLAELRMQADDPRAAFDALREAEQAFPDLGATIRPRQVQALLAALLKEPPVAAVALFDTHVGMLPPGAETEAALSTLADRLAALDLLDRARNVLGRALARAANAESRARLGLRLAGLALGAGDAAGARAALSGTAAPDLPETLQRERLVTEARALVQMGDDGAAAARYRAAGPLAAGELAEFLASRQDWAGAAASMRDHLATVLPPAPAPLDDQARQLVARAAALLSLAGDQAGLQALRRAEGGRMAGGALEDAFALMTSERIGSVNDLPRLRAELEAVRRLPARFAARAEARP